MRPSPFQLALLLSLFALPAAADAQAPTTGPIITSTGAVYPVEASVPTPLDIDYRVAFDISQGGGSDRASQSLNTVARFLNMHAQAGVPRDRIDAAVVVHGSAVTDVLNAESYRDREGGENPNAAQIRALMDAGVRVIVCGQSAASRGVGASDLTEGVELALSAMTAFVILQSEGYLVNPW
jgi:intracellular sulfur oxidation DsrE/DsrF family protein